MFAQPREAFTHRRQFASESAVGEARTRAGPARDGAGNLEQALDLANRTGGWRARRRESASGRRRSVATGSDRSSVGDQSVEAASRELTQRPPQLAPRFLLLADQPSQDKAAKPHLQIGFVHGHSAQHGKPAFASKPQAPRAGPLKGLSPRRAAGIRRIQMGSLLSGCSSSFPRRQSCSSPPCSPSVSARFSTRCFSSSLRWQDKRAPQPSGRGRRNTRLQPIPLLRKSDIVIRAALLEWAFVGSALVHQARHVVPA